MINNLLIYPFELKIATRDYHPADHISFASQHAGAQPFTSTHTITNPENEEEKQTTRLWPDHCVQGTPGCELIDELDTSKLDLVLDKGQDKRVESYSAFGPPFRSPKVSMTGLADTLREHEIRVVFIVGLAFDYCVKYTAIDAVKEGFKTTVFEALTPAVDASDENLAATRTELTDHGVNVFGPSAKAHWGTDECAPMRPS